MLYISFSSPAKHPVKPVIYIYSVNIIHILLIKQISIIIACILICIYLQNSETFKYCKLFLIHINKYVVQLHSIAQWHNCTFSLCWMLLW
jgi:hypothetical protein